MTKTNDAIKALIEKARNEFGGKDSITYLESAYHACNPSRPHGWSCDAIQIKGDVIVLGKAQWDFESDMGDYDWSDGGDEITDVEEFDLNDADDAAQVLNILKNQIR